MLTVDILSLRESWVPKVCNISVVKEVFSSCAQRLPPEGPGARVADAGAICPETETTLGNIIRLPVCTKQSPYSLYHYLSFIH